MPIVRFPFIHSCLRCWDWLPYLSNSVWRAQRGANATSPPGQVEASQVNFLVHPSSLCLAMEIIVGRNRGLGGTPCSGPGNQSR
jgi:hypothetical protein